MMAATTEDRLEAILENWAQSMRSGTGVDGYNHESSGFVGGGYMGDFDDMVQAADRRLAAATNTVIDDLTPVERCAIHHRYLRSLFRFRDYERTLIAAKENVRRGLKRRGVPTEW